VEAEAGADLQELEVEVLEEIMEAPPMTGGEKRNLSTLWNICMSVYSFVKSSYLCFLRRLPAFSKFPVKEKYLTFCLGGLRMRIGVPFYSPTRQ